MTINNITRMLDAHKIPYKAFELPPKKLSAREVAEFLKVDPGLVWKTIVVLRQQQAKPMLVVLPGNCEVDLKALAKFIGEKKVVIPAEREAERITGLQAGGISPLALLKKGFQIILDQSCHSLNEIYISGGQRGLNLLISVVDFIKLTGGQIADIALKR